MREINRIVLIQDFLFLQEETLVTLTTNDKMRNKYATSCLVSVFMDTNMAITSADEARLTQLMDVLKFFNDWEKKSTQTSSKLTEQTRDDLNSSILGFVTLCQPLQKLGISIILGLKLCLSFLRLRQGKYNRIFIQFPCKL
jgi:hypothetical protein